MQHEMVLILHYGVVIQGHIFQLDKVQMHMIIPVYGWVMMDSLRMMDLDFQLSMVVTILSGQEINY